MSQRPTTGMRLGTGRIGTAARRGTAGIRIGTGRVGTARLGTAARAVAGGVLTTQVAVGHRPMTQQGLGGTQRLATQAGQGRVVLDETYFLGALRSKSSELSNEINRMRDEIAKFERQADSYVAFEKKAEKLAAEIKGLQGQLADTNLLLDHLRTNTDMADVAEDRKELKAANDIKQAEIDKIFTERQTLERQVKTVEEEMERQKSADDALTENMTPDQRARYDELKAASTEYKAKAEAQQTQLEDLTKTLEQLERELASAPLKREAVALTDQLAALKQKEATLMEQIEQEKAESPEQQRERLLTQVKTDNQDIAAMERKMGEAQREIDRLTTELDEMEEGDAQEDEEKRQKYQQLVKHDQEMNEFMSSFEATMADATERVEEREQHVQELLEAISRHMDHAKQLPSTEDHTHLRDDLAFKEREMQRSEATAQSLEGKRAGLARDLRNVEQIEDKIASEMAELKEQLGTMREELVVYSDTDRLTRDIEEERRALAQEKRRCMVRKEAVKRVVQELAAQHEKLKAQMQKNETWTQLLNLEKKWQHYEKNNFVMRDIIASKTKEADHEAAAGRVRGVMQSLQEKLQVQYA